MESSKMFQNAEMQNETKKYQFSNIPQRLKAERRWVVWKRETTDKGKPTKVPYQPNGKHAKSTKPETWSSYDEVIAAPALTFDGIGFVLGQSLENPDVNYCGIDLDKHIDSDGNHSLLATDLLIEYDTYWEVSPSGTGMKGIAIGKKPGTRCEVYQEEEPDGRKPSVEFYDHGRYFCLTGWHIEDTPTTIEYRQTKIESIYHQLFPPEVKPEVKSKTPPPMLNLDDAQLIEIAENAHNGVKFAKLRAGDASDYPRNDGTPDNSRADLAFANRLAFWTQDDAIQMDRIFRDSGLMRDKWDEKRGNQTYGAGVINKALNDPHPVYNPRRTTNPQKNANSDDITDSLRNVSKKDGNSEGVSTNTDEDKKSADFGFDDELIKYTDGWRAKRLVILHGENFRWIGDRGKWIVWDGQRFVVDELERMTQLAKTVKHDILCERTVAIETGGHKEADKLLNEARKMDSQAKYTSMVNLAMSEPNVAIYQADLDSDSLRLNVANGIVDLRTGELMPHQRSALMTKLAPVHYDESAVCPSWHEFLNRIMSGNTELIRFLQRAVGYALTASIREPVLFILHGTGANGKTTFLETVGRMLGDYAKHSPENLLVNQMWDKHPAGLASLMDARLVVHPELGNGVTLDEGFVKRATGGDTLTARFMRQDYFDFKPTHKLFLPTNELPEISGTDDGIWRRVRKIPFDVRIPDEEQIPLEIMLASLEKEWSGILRWAIEGCLDWQENGLGFPVEIKDATDSYRQDSDVIANFIEDRLVVEWTGEVSATALYNAFKAWCSDNGEALITQTKFGKRMTTKGIKKSRKRTGVVYEGISLR